MGPEMSWIDVTQKNHAAVRPVRSDIRPLPRPVVSGYPGYVGRVGALAGVSEI